MADEQQSLVTTIVETGDEAALALLACTPSGAAKLVEFHSSGALGKMPRPPDLLRVIAMCGEDVLLFAIQYAKELEEPDAFSAFIQAPLDYALGAFRLIRECCMAAILATIVRQRCDALAHKQASAAGTEGG